MRVNACAARAAEPMVGVAQLVELRIVDPAVVGSNPIVHPKIVTPAGIGCSFAPEQTDYVPWRTHLKSDLSRRARPGSES